MSSAPIYNYVPGLHDPSQESAIENPRFYGSHNTTPPESHLLSPYSNFQTLSNTVSPSQHNQSTPADLTPDNGGYSDLSDLEDEFYGVNFDTGDQFANLNFFDLPTSQLDNTISPQLGLGIPTFEHQRKLSSETRSSAATQYPPSPNLTSTPSPETTPPAFGVNDNKLTETSFADMDASLPHHQGDRNVIHSAVPYHPTPDISSSSQASVDAFPAMSGHIGQSPRVLVSQWGQQPQGLGPYPTDNSFSGSYDHSQNATIPAQYDESPESLPADLRSGLDPESRQPLANAQVPNFKEQERRLELQRKNREVTDWVSQAGGAGEGEDQNPPPFFSLAAPVVRQRAKSTSAVNQYSESPFAQPASAVRAIDDDGIKPASDDDKVTENKLVEGQLYFDLQATEIKPSDIAELQQLRRWEDPPRVPYITSSKTQASTANEAMSQWNRNADTFSLISRSATWGTRRKSEPNLAELTEGGLLKRLTISNKGRSRQNSIFKNIGSPFQKRSDSTPIREKSKLKRSFSNKDNKEFTPTPPNRKDSSSSLAPPPRTSSFGRTNKTPSLNTQIAAMGMSISAVGATHTRSGSISAADPSQMTSPKSPLGVAKSFIRRARSRSDLGREREEPTEGLVGLWRGQGGPPVPTLSTPASELPKIEAPRVQDYNDHEVEVDDDDDDYGDDNDLGFENDQNASSIVPNLQGFREHVLRLNPKNPPSYLVDRIAFQQCVRYKQLLTHRVKHSQVVNDRTCSSGTHCMNMGGIHTLLDAKGNPREAPLSAGGLQITTDLSDGDSNPGEGVLLPDTFPQGVPMPPTPCLPAEFECQLCFKVKKFQKPSDWTKHVQEDVQPFTCTYSNCKESKSFKRKADWVRHENERHRHLEWWTCQVDDCTHKCYRKDNFLQHLVREHKLPEPKAKTKAAVKRTRGGQEDEVWLMLERCHHTTTNQPKDEPCKFCGKEFTTWKKLTVHLAKHMEQIALPVLKLVEQMDVDQNTIISPVEQSRQVPPLTPVIMTRQESEGSAQYSNTNISPQIPTVPSQFPAYDNTAMFYPPGTADQPMVFNPLTTLPPQSGNVFDNNIFSSSFGQIDPQLSQQPRGFSNMPDQYSAQTFQPFPTTQTLASNAVAYGTGPPQNSTYQNPMIGLGSDQFTYRDVPQQQQQQQTFPTQGYAQQGATHHYPSTTLPEYRFPPSES